MRNLQLFIAMASKTSTNISMKKLFFVALTALPTMLCAQSGTFTVKGKLGALNAPNKVYLRYSAGTTSKLDSAQLQNGAFEFKGTVEAPQKANLMVDYGKGMRQMTQKQVISLYLESGTISVISPDSAHRAVVSGTPLNVDNENLKAALKPTNEKMEKLMQEYRTASAEQRKSKEFNDDIEKRYSALETEQKNVWGTFIKNTPQSLVSLDALRSYGGYAPEYADVAPLFNSLSDNVKTSKAGKEYATTLASIKATSVGELAPDFTQADTLGKAVALHDFKGKYVLVDFWASWCGPCRQENPNVVKNFHQFKGQNFTVLGVSLDRPNAKEAWLNAIHKDQLAWTHVSDLKFWDNEVAKQYGIRAIPQNFLIGPDGKIVAKNIRGEDLGKKLAELLPAKP